MKLRITQAIGIAIFLLIIFSCKKKDDPDFREYQILAKQLRLNNPDSCLKVYDIGLALAIERDDDYFKTYFTYEKGQLLGVLNRFEESNQLLHQLKRLAQNNNDKKHVVRAYFELGNNYYFSSKIDSAEYYYTLGQEILETYKNDDLSCRLTYYQACIYVAKAQHHKAIELFESCVGYAEKVKNERIIVASLTNLASSYSAVGDLNQSAESVFRVLRLHENNAVTDEEMVVARCLFTEALKEALSPDEYRDFIMATLKLAHKTESARAKCLAFHKASCYFRENGDHLKSIDYTLKALPLANRGGLESERGALFNNLATAYQHTGDLHKALLYTNKAIANAQSNNDNRRLVMNTNLKSKILIRQNKPERALELLTSVVDIDCPQEQKIAVYNNLVGIYKNQNNLKQALAYLERVRQTESEIQKTHNTILIKELKTKYETEKKEQQIELLKITNQNTELALNKSNQEKQIMIIGLFSILALLIPITLYRRQKNHNKLLQARITSGDSECTRIAKELHDNISGNLTTLRFSLESNTDHEILGESIKSISNEVRSISHKLNINALADQDFKTAIYDALMLDHFPQHIDLNIQLLAKINEKNLDLKINLIRILQELVQNTLKHSGADRIEISLQKQQRKLHLEYSDNGKGCDLSCIKQGNGIKNIQDRVAYIKGQVSFDSQENNGYYCNIAI